jgi:UDP-MurNAc hydroxylase
MFFQILSHASLLVRSGGKTLLTDPWLLGSCYWRSWWNYPPVKPQVMEGLQPDVIYLTHVHWDHFHGATLRRFSKDTRFVIPFERSTRVKRDLNAMGFHNVTEVPHAKSFALTDDFKITSYQFSPWGDSAVVIETEGISLLNANDAKFMGGPLNQILRNHKSFDFAFRSHSSANDRVCHHYTDKGADKEEDPMMYAESFFHFMEKVKPRYAVPFASNHCHLHRDVFHLNRMIETPVRVQDYVASAGGFSASELKVMVSGDSWDSHKGFDIPPNTWFSDRESHLEHYLASQEEKLNATYAVEDKVRVRLSEVEKYFGRFFKVVPFFLKRSFAGKPIILCAKYSGGVDYFEIDMHKGRVRQITESDRGGHPIQFETAGFILKRAMGLNMFSHVGISKLVVYRSLQADAGHLRRFNELLAAYEYEVLPLGKLFSMRTARVYLRRWREILLYAQLAAGILAGKTVHQIEAKQLAAIPRPKPTVV